MKLLLNSHGTLCVSYLSLGSFSVGRETKSCVLYLLLWKSHLKEAVRNGWNISISDICIIGCAFVQSNLGGIQEGSSQSVGAMVIVELAQHRSLHSSKDMV